MSDRRPATNLRLLRIAEGICSCVLTDGFCGPKHRPDCRCWVAARAALEGVRQQANPVLAEAWPSVPGPRDMLEALCDAIRYRDDELTKEHAAPPGKQKKATMNIFDVQRIIKWTMAFQRNLICADRELSASELGKAAAACQHGRDPWESAYEIRASDQQRR